jgi:hypothetical protein
MGGLRNFNAEVLDPKVPHSIVGLEPALDCAEPGYVSLYYLKRLASDYLKIDGELITPTMPRKQDHVGHAPVAQLDRAPAF